MVKEKGTGGGLMAAVKNLIEKTPAEPVVENPQPEEAAQVEAVEAQAEAVAKAEPETPAAEAVEAEAQVVEEPQAEGALEENPQPEEAAQVEAVEAQAEAVAEEQVTMQDMIVVLEDLKKAETKISSLETQLESDKKAREKVEAAHKAEMAKIADRVKSLENGREKQKNQTIQTVNNTVEIAMGSSFTDFETKFSKKWDDKLARAGSVMLELKGHLEDGLQAIVDINELVPEMRQVPGALKTLNEGLEAIGEVLKARDQIMQAINKSTSSAPAPSAEATKAPLFGKKGA